MAYALRYYKEIAQTDGGVVRLEIHKKGSTAQAVEIGAVVQGLSLEIQGQQDDIDTPIQKTSLHMTFVDAQDIENGKKNGFWEEFYTPNALLWKVVLKAKNAKETSFRTIWGGYVTPDSFSEDLVYRGSVSITARDNIGHMQDFPFDAMGDADGMISLYNLVSMGWEKIQSPMSLSWAGIWLESDGVVAYETLMNVSQFQGKDWYKAIETALASYGAVMRYVGNNTVIITTLRSLPSQGGDVALLPHIEPKFVTGAQRELVPAVKRIEETVDYVLEDSWSIPQIRPSDFNGNIYTYRCKVDGENWGTLEHDAPVWAIPINVERGWNNIPSESLFFDIDAYEVGYFSDYRGLGEEMKRYMYIAANNVDDRSVWYSKQITCADMSLRIKFGLPVCLNRNNEVEQMSVFALKSIRYTISLKKDGSVSYYAGGGTWQASEKILEKTYEITANETEFVEQIGMDDNVGICDLVFEIKKIEYAKIGYGSIANIGLYACIQDIAFTTASTSSLRETNTVNTSYNSDNNVILSRDPELGPAFDKVAIPAFIKNGIFYRNVDGEILPARLWSWDGREQQIAVWNHLQLLCYYAKPNNLISGTIVNADLTRVANIWMWHGAEHILISGTYNFLNGMIESAVLREFARYDGMWSDVPGAAMPDTEQNSRSNVEGGSSSSSASTYNTTTTVVVGGGDGGFWELNDDVLSTDFYTRINNSLIVQGDIASGGQGGATSVGVSGIKVNGNTYRDSDDGILDGIIDLGTIQSGGGGITNITSQMVIDALQYTPLSTEGGTMTGTLMMSGGNIQMSGSGHIVTNEVYPKTTDTYYLGSDSRRWKNIVTQNINGYTPIHSGNIRSQHVTYAEKLTTGTYQYATFDATNKYVAFGDFAAKSGGYATYIDGSNIYLRVNQGTSVAMSVATNADVTFEKNIIVKGDVASGGGGTATTSYLPLTGGNVDYLTISNYTAIHAGNVNNYLTKIVTNSGDTAISVSTSNNVNYLTNNGCVYIKPTTEYSYDQGIRIGYSNSQQISAIWMNVESVSGYNAGMWGITCAKGGNLRFRGGASSAADIMNLTQSGEVLIGATTSQSYKFYVNGTSLFSDRVSVGKAVAQQTSGRSQLSVVSTTDLPCDLILGANAPHWSFTARNSTEAGVAGAYGLGIYSYRHSSYRLYIKDNGYIYTASNVIAGGSVTQNSDMRLKNKMYDYNLDLSVIAHAPLFTFMWNDGRDSELHIGTSAQYWESIAPQLVVNDTYKSLDYATLGVAMGISLARKTRNLEQRIIELEAEVERLRQA